MIGPVAVVPSTPLLLPGMPGEPEPTMARLARAAARALQDTAAVDLVVVLAGGTSLAADPAPSTDLSGYGLDLPARARDAAPAAVMASVERIPGLTVGAGYAGDLSVLARQVPDGPPVLGLTVPTDITVEQAGTVAEVLVGLGGSRQVALVVAGDLGAGHGVKPPRPQADVASAAFDQAVVAALDNGRPADLLRLDPALARDACARGAGPLRVLGAVLQQVPLGTVVRAAAAPLGVGYVVAQGA